MKPFLAETNPGDPVDWLAEDMRWRYRELVEAVAEMDFPEPHSTKAIDDLTEWSFEIDPEHLIASCVELTKLDPQ